MTTPDGIKTYLTNGLEGTPVILRTLLASFSGSDPRWDLRPDPERFTLREVMAHIADWDSIFMGRIERLRDQDGPFLESEDEGKLAAERNYGSQDPRANQLRFEENRAALLALIRSIQGDAWERPGHREFVGDITMAQQITMILGHDAYHLRQVAEVEARAS